jgi:hypothetical protein
VKPVHLAFAALGFVGVVACAGAEGLPSDDSTVAGAATAAAAPTPTTAPVAQRPADDQNAPIQLACVQQSPANVVPGAGFDTEGWSGNPVVADDASACASSKSLRLVSPGGMTSPYHYAHSTCFKVAPNTSYGFGAAVKRVKGAPVYCAATFYKEGGCSLGNQILGSAAEIQTKGTGAWERLSTVKQAPADAALAEVHCVTDGEALVDEVFLGPAPGGF